jgi:hypothetical protein
MSPTVIKFLVKQGEVGSGANSEAMDHSSLGSEGRLLELDEGIYMSLPREYPYQTGRPAWNKRLTDNLKLSAFQPLINAESVCSSLHLRISCLSCHLRGRRSSGLRIGTSIKEGKDLTVKALLNQGPWQCHVFPG